MPPRLNCLAPRSVARAIQRTTTRATTVVTRVPVSATQSVQRLDTRQYATAIPPSIPGLKLPDDYIPPTQPPSARRPEMRKTQLFRSYTALLRSTPLMLFFQHSNLTAVEWAAVRRELRHALAEVPLPAAGPDGAPPVDFSQAVEFQVLRTRIFSAAYRVVDFFDPEAYAKESNAYTHDLSKTAFEAVRSMEIPESSTYAQIKPLLVGPIAVVSFPMVSPAHLAAALKVLAPSPPAFPAPSRKKYPGYHDPTAQSGLQKLILVGGRVEGKAFDYDGVKWVGGIEGGLEGLRSQLVSMLQSAGLGLTTALEGQSKGLWLALEGRRTQLEEEANGGKKEGETDAAAAGEAAS